MQIAVYVARYKAIGDPETFDTQRNFQIKGPSPDRAWDFRLRGSTDTVEGMTVLLTDIFDNIGRQSLQWMEENRFDIAVAWLVDRFKKYSVGEMDFNDEEGGCVYEVRIAQLDRHIDFVSSLRFG